jgi:transglutaminase-like putative cysteine protease
MFERIKLEEGWTTLLLVWSLIAVTGLAIITAELTDEGLGVLMVVGTGGVLAGLLLAKSSFSARKAHMISLVYGLALLAYAVGGLLPADLPWRLRIIDLVQRQAVWLTKATEGGISRDTIIFIVQTAAIFWLLGYTASWYTFREPRVWRVVLPTGLVLLSVIYYYYGPKPLIVYLAIYALLALLYIARTHLVDREKVWRSGSVRYEGDIRFDFLRASFIVGALVLLLAGNLPALGASAEVSGAFSEVNQPWRRFQDNWTRLFSSLRSYGTGTNDAYGDTMVLGGPRTVGNILIMDIRVPYRLAYVYWQGVALDTYDGHGGWSNNSNRTLTHYPDEGEIEMPVVSARQVVTQTVVNYSPNAGTIYGAPDVIFSDRQLLLDVNRQGDVTQTVNWIRSRFVLRQGDSYQLLSAVSTADKTSLRKAGSDYSPWITEHYLQLPDNITPETIQLAEQLTAPYDNAFDKAIAVRDYLRTEIAYNDQIDAPPDDVEPVHYTLFESKEAYCTYYASAMAVMLRSQGIPTRIVNGYAQGEWVEEASLYRVRASNAHTWVEVYFPRYGWIQFEPTASIPVSERPDGPPGGNAGDAFGFNNPLAASAADQSLTAEDIERMDAANREARLQQLLEGETDAAARAEQAQTERVMRIVGGGMLLLFAGGLVTVANQANKKVESDVEKSFGRLGTWSRWLQINVRNVDTPYERADRLAQAIPEGRSPIRSLTHQYVLRRFSPGHRGDEAFDPASEWKLLRPMLLRETIRRQWQRLRDWRLRRR